MIQIDERRLPGGEKYTKVILELDDWEKLNQRMVNMENRLRVLESGNPPPQEDPAPADDLLKWDKKEITYWVDYRNAHRLGLSRVQMAREIQKQFRKIETVADIKIVPGRGLSSDLVIRFGEVDGEGNVLAFVYQPSQGSSMAACGGQCGDYMFDTAEDYSMTDFGNIFLHESGHAMGIGHGPQGSTMGPSYRIGSPELQVDNWMARELILRYTGAPA